MSINPENLPTKDTEGPVVCKWRETNERPEKTSTMESNKKERPWYRKLKGLLIFFPVAVAFAILNLYLDDARRSVLPSEKVRMESGTPVAIAGFETYTDKSKGLQVIFPEQPEVTTLEFGGYPVINYKSSLVIDDENYTQYSVTYIDTEIYSTESINAYLNNFSKGKIIGLGSDAKLVVSEVTKYKGLPARRYLIEYTSEGVKIYDKGIVFVANGDPVNLSVSYPSTMDSDDTHFNEFTNSFVLN